jgi:nucleoside phosphorylase
MIFHFCPRYLSMVGITAGVRGQVEIGDIVVADPCWDWGSGKLTLGDTGDVFQPDPLPHRLDSHLRALFLETQRDKELLHRVWEEWPGSKPDSPPKLHVGPCVSGACVLANENSVQGICEHSRKLVGIDMEAYGVMHAGSQSLLPHPLTFSMKGVSDFADSAKDDSYRDYAAYVSAAVLRAVAVKFFGKPAV